LHFFTFGISFLKLPLIILPLVMECRSHSFLVTVCFF
jgi:hypothetical protein